MKTTASDLDNVLEFFGLGGQALRFIAMLALGGGIGVMLAFSLNHVSRTKAAPIIWQDETNMLEGSSSLKLARVKSSQAEEGYPVSSVETRFRTLDSAPSSSLPARPRIAIVIDDMSADWDQVHRVGDLPAPLTLSFLPYYNALASRIAYVKNQGHGVMLHLPMEAVAVPEQAQQNPGPDALLIHQGDAEIEARLARNLSQFSGYSGVNNHMGSRFTARLDKMTPVMRGLKSRGLFFLDSVTTGGSAAQAAARAQGVPFLARDVFLDAAHEGDTAYFVRDQLRKTERIAQEKGYAIAIAHPHQTTLETLGPWLVSAYARGFEVVTVEALVASFEAEPPTSTVAFAPPDERG